MMDTPYNKSPQKRRKQLKAKRRMASMLPPRPRTPRPLKIESPEPKEPPRNGWELSDTEKERLYVRWDAEDTAKGINIDDPIVESPAIPRSRYHDSNKENAQKPEHRVGGGARDAMIGAVFLLGELCDEADGTPAIDNFYTHAKGEHLFTLQCPFLCSPKKNLQRMLLSLVAGFDYYYGYDKTTLKTPGLAFLLYTLNYICHMRNVSRKKYGGVFRPTWSNICVLVACGMHVASMFTTDNPPSPAIVCYWVNKNQSMDAEVLTDMTRRYLRVLEWKTWIPNQYYRETMQACLEKAMTTMHMAQGLQDVKL